MRVEVDNGEFGRVCVADEGVARRGVHVEQFLQHGFGGEGFAVLVAEVEGGGAGEGGEEEQGFFHGLCEGGICGTVERR